MWVLSNVDTREFVSIPGILSARARVSTTVGFAGYVLCVSQSRTASTTKQCVNSILDNPSGNQYCLQQ